MGRQSNSVVHFCVVAWFYFSTKTDTHGVGQILFFGARYSTFAPVQKQLGHKRHHQQGNTVSGKHHCHVSLFSCSSVYSVLHKGWSSRKLGCTGNEVTCKISSVSPCHCNTDFHPTEFMGSLSSHFFCRLRASWRFSVFLGIFFSPARATLLASKMASMTLEVKIINQSCKQRKRRGRSWGKQVTNEKHISASQV